MTAHWHRSFVRLCVCVLAAVCIADQRYQEIRRGPVEVEGVADYLGSSTLPDLRHSGIPAAAGPPEMHFRVVRHNAAYYNCSMPLKRGSDLRAGDRVIVSGTLMEVRDRQADQFNSFHLTHCRLVSRESTPYSMPGEIVGIIMRRVPDQRTGTIGLHVTDDGQQRYVCPLEALIADKYRNGDRVRIRGYLHLPSGGVSRIANCVATPQ